MHDDFIRDPAQLRAYGDEIRRGAPDRMVEKMPDFGGVAGYEDLERVLTLAYDQSARGKGAERHARGQEFENQPIRTIPLMLGAHEGIGGLAYQIIKKTQESVGMTARGNTAHAKKELLGAIVYAAAAYLHIEHYEDKA